MYDYGRSSLCACLPSTINQHTQSAKLYISLAFLIVLVFIFVCLSENLSIHSHSFVDLSAFHVSPHLVFYR